MKGAPNPRQTLALYALFGSTNAHPTAPGDGRQHARGQQQSDHTAGEKHRAEGLGKAGRRCYHQGGVDQGQTRQPLHPVSGRAERAVDEGGKELLSPEGTGVPPARVAQKWVALDRSAEQSSAQMIALALCAVTYQLVLVCRANRQLERFVVSNPPPSRGVCFLLSA